MNNDHTIRMITSALMDLDKIMAVLLSVASDNIQNPGVERKVKKIVNILYSLADEIKGLGTEITEESRLVARDPVVPTSGTAKWWDSKNSQFANKNNLSPGSRLPERLNRDVHEVLENMMKEKLNETPIELDVTCESINNGTVTHDFVQDSYDIIESFHGTGILHPSIDDWMD